MFMRKLFDSGETIYRVLSENEDRLLVINCVKRTMSSWITKDVLSSCTEINESIFYMTKQV